LSTDDDLSAEGRNLFVECVDGSCKNVNGYVFNNDKGNIIRNGKKTGETLSVDESIENEISCSDDKIGRVLKDKSAICYKPGKSIKMEKNSVKYLVKGWTNFESIAPVKSGEGYVVIDGFINDGKYLKEDKNKSFFNFFFILFYFIFIF